MLIVLHEINLIQYSKTELLIKFNYLYKAFRNV